MGHLVTICCSLTVRKRQDRQHYMISHSSLHRPFLTVSRCLRLFPDFTGGPVDEILNETIRQRRVLDMGCRTASFPGDVSH